MESVQAYINQLPEEHQRVIQELRNTINKAIPEGFEETISYKMIGWVVPHSRYPAGYHCDPSLPLPFASIAAQKNHYALYHMGIYANPSLLDWFVNEYPRHSNKKLNMGKSCIRFKKATDIPHELIGQLMNRMTPDEMIAIYENSLKK